MQLLLDTSRGETRQQVCREGMDAAIVEEAGAGGLPRDRETGGVERKESNSIEAVAWAVGVQ